MKNMEAEATERASEFINSAEEMFGPMCSQWEYDGVIFNDSGPALDYAPHEGRVSIALSPKAKNNAFQRDFQLSHEVCHLLWPAAPFSPGVGKIDYAVPSTNVINEGISTYFSILAITSIYGASEASVALKELCENRADYYLSFEAVSKLLELEPEAIKKIRQVNPMVNELTVDNFYQAEIRAPKRLMDLLLTPFDDL